MSSSSSTSTNTAAQKKYKGVRRRKWGKWVSEIRVPGSQERLWLGSYSSAEAAAVAYDLASYCLRGQSSIDGLNFPLMLPASVRADMSPKSIQKAASDAGMAVDARMIMNKHSILDNEVKENEMVGAVLAPEVELLREDVVGGRGNCDGSQSGEDTDQGLSNSVEDYL